MVAILVGTDTAGVVAKEKAGQVLGFRQFDFFFGKVSVGEVGHFGEDGLDGAFEVTGCDGGVDEEDADIAVGHGIGVDVVGEAGFFTDTEKEAGAEAAAKEGCQQGRSCAVG